MATRYESGPHRLQGSREDINTAVKINDQAVESAFEDDPDRPIYLHNLGCWLQLQFEQTGLMNDLDAAVKAKQKAAKLSPIDHPDRALRLNIVGNAFRRRFECTESPEDLSSALKNYEESVETVRSPPHIRILSAICGANLLYSRDVKGANRLLTTAVQLLPKTSPSTLDRNDQQFALSQFAGLASDAAALSIRSGDDLEQVLRLLELGRGVMASFRLDVRSDVSQLKAAHPKLAAQFEHLRDELDLPNDDLGHPSSHAQRSQRRYEALKEFEDSISLIRSHDGFKNFLLGPSSEELKNIATHGPMVFLNVSHYGSDAFLITHEDIRHLPLINLTYADMETKSDELLELLANNHLYKNAPLMKILEWLWDVAIEPVLEELGFAETPQNDSLWPHIWWIPAGRLALFPIHAAGYHSIKSDGRTVLDRVISSYSPTVRALANARVQIERLSSTTSQSVLMVSMPTTPNKKDLPFAAKEITVIDKLLPRSMVLQYPNKEKVLQKLSQCSIAHFACHGEANTDPSKSQILFSDWECNPFSVADMAQKKIESAELAYLSACDSAANRDLAMLDESIHMTGACQLAGFPTVVGTLWKIMDEQSVTVAKSVYNAMLTKENRLDIRKSACGLHFAIRKIRDSSLQRKRAKNSNPIVWAVYPCRRIV
jgi:hypothetical protein